MALLVHNQKYEASPRLHDSVDWPDLRVEHLRLEPRGMKPVTFTCNEIAVVLAGRTVATRTGNGVTQRSLIQTGASCVNPVGTYESQADISSPIEDLHIFVPPALVGDSASADYDIDPAKAELAYVGGLKDPLIYQIALAFHDMISRPLALETGFASQANFIRAFRKSTGLTPGQFRALHRR